MPLFCISDGDRVLGVKRDPQTQANRRLLGIALFCAVWTVAILARLFYLQVLFHADYVRVARQQQTKVAEAPA
ncbi:MAG TPA: hypothetical protein DEH78_19740, partial [Solibacterales bacterium]|nr:hypothetical protein [Bryobacterales bacterium]